MLLNSQMGGVPPKEEKVQGMEYLFFSNELERFLSLLRTLTSIEVVTLSNSITYVKVSKETKMSLFFTRSYLLTLNNLFPDFSSRFSSYDQLNLMRNCLKLTSGLEGVFKYWTAYPMASLMKRTSGVPDLNSLPPIKSLNSFGWTGNVKRFLKNRLNTSRGILLAQNILQGVKRACDTVSDTFVQQTMIDHLEILTTPSKGYDLSDLSPLIARVCQTFHQSERIKMYEPSRKACFEYREKGWKQYNEVVTELSLAYRKQVILPNDEIYGYDVPTPDEVLSHIDLTAVSDVTVVPVREPLKCRIITKGNALPMYYSRFFQKKMKSWLDTIPCFILTKEPLSVDHLNKLNDLTETINLSSPEELRLFVSGDYKSATDLLDISLTKMIFEELLSKSDIGQMDKMVLRSVLYEQNLYWGNPPHREFKGRQVNGQLMGSILSFPILCLANLVCYWASLERYLGHSVPLERLPVLINGDDILFKTNERHYQIWLTEIDRVGFRLSVGKNYVHPRYLTVNSTMFSYVDGSFKEVPYLNNGLLTGISKLGPMKQELTFQQIAEKVFSGSSNHPFVQSRFIYYQKERINAITLEGKYNLFLPVYLGGIGIRPLLPPSYTRFQLQLAQFLYRRLSDYPSKPPSQAVKLVDKSSEKLIDAAYNVRYMRTYSSFDYDLSVPERLKDLVLLEPQLVYRHMSLNSFQRWRRKYISSRESVPELPKHLIEPMFECRYVRTAAKYLWRERLYSSFPFMRDDTWVPFWS